MMYDEMGNLISTDGSGYLTPYDAFTAQQEEEERRRREEEERRRREEEANRLVTKQQVETYGDGSRTIKTTEEIPAGQGLKPRAVSPDDIFGRQIMAESGGQHINPRTNEIMTSPKGALGIAQIMPETARSPGFGIKPISPEELRTPEGNLAFGKRYKQGMLDLFGGDQAKATAAYNAGPGRVQQAIKQAEATGGNWQDFIPNETKKYLGKVLNAIIPSAQAGELPRGSTATPGIAPPGVNRDAGAGRGFVNPPTVGEMAQNQAPEAPKAPKAPEAPDDSVINNAVADYESRQKYGLGTGQGEPGLRAGTPVPAGQDSSRYIEMYQTQQDNPQAMMAMGYDDKVPEWLRDRSRNRAADLITQQREIQRAQETLKNASETDIARYLREKTTGGSYAKMILWAALGAKGKAAEEQAKLGIGVDKLLTGPNGEPAIVKMSSNGTPLEGYNAKTGKKLTPQELVGFAAGAGAGKWSTTAEFFQDKAGNVYQAQHNDRGQTRIINTKTNEVYSGEEKLQRLRDVSSMNQMTQQQQYRRENMRTQFANQISKLNYESRLKAFDEYNKALAGEGLPLLTYAEMGLRPDGTLIGEAQGGAQGGQQGGQQGGGQVTAKPTPVEPTPAAGGQQGGGQVTAKPTPVEPGATAADSGKRPTMSEIQANKAAKKEEAEIVGKDIGTIRANQGKSEANADYLLTKIDQVVGNPAKGIKPHPGLKFGVGVADIGENTLGFGIPIPYGATIAGKIPGTDTNDFNARMQEIGGQSFLQAIENLRGMGALSNQEGETATRAVQRMTTAQSEKEFKAAARDFQDVIQRGIDRNRKKLGQDAKYGTPPASEKLNDPNAKVKPLTADDRRALDWARQNPDDPRAAEIKRRLGL